MCVFKQISKTLVDVQLENNRLQEDAAAINFDLNNKVLGKFLISKPQKASKNVNRLHKEFEIECLNPAHT